VDGTLVVDGGTTINAPLTTATTSTVDVRTTMLTTPQSWSNNGTLRLTAVTTAANPTLAMTGQTFTNTATGVIDLPHGAGSNKYLTAALVENYGAMNVNTGFILTGTLNQRNLFTITSPRNANITTMNLLSGSTTTVQAGASLTVGTCSNTGGTVVGSVPAACNP